MGTFDNLGQALRWLRSRQQRRQYEIADAAGITKAMLSAYETGKQKPSIETLDKLLTALGADLSELHEALLLQQGGRLGDPVRSRRTDLPRADHASTASGLAATTGSTDALPAEWEGPLSQMLDGFNSLVRHLHRQIEGTSGGETPPFPAGASRPGPRRIEAPPLDEDDEER